MGRRGNRRRSRAKQVLARVCLAALAAYALVVLAVNGGVIFVSSAGLFPLDPRHLKAKARALASYARHRSVCLLWKDADVRAAARAAALKNGVEPELFEALVEVESGAIAHRISFAGACGPAQLTLRTAHDLDVADPFEPGAALDGGARLLRQNLDRFHGRRDLALAAYNAGPGAVHGAVPHNGETEFYVPRVLSLYLQKRGARLEAEKRLRADRIAAAQRARAERSEAELKKRPHAKRRSRRPGAPAPSPAPQRTVPPDPPVPYVRRGA